MVHVTNIFTPNSVKTTDPFTIEMYKSFDPFDIESPLTNKILSGSFKLYDTAFDSGQLDEGKFYSS